MTTMAATSANNPIAGAQSNLGQFCFGENNKMGAKFTRLLLLLLVVVCCCCLSALLLVAGDKNK